MGSGYTCLITWYDSHECFSMDNSTVVCHHPMTDDVKYFTWRWSRPIQLEDDRSSEDQKIHLPSLPSLASFNWPLPVCGHITGHLSGNTGIVDVVESDFGSILHRCKLVRWADQTAGVGKESIRVDLGHTIRLLTVHPCHIVVRMERALLAIHGGYHRHECSLWEDYTTTFRELRTILASTCRSKYSRATATFDDRRTGDTKGGQAHWSMCYHRRPWTTSLSWPILACWPSTIATLGVDDVGHRHSSSRWRRRSCPVSSVAMSGWAIELYRRTSRCPWRWTGHPWAPELREGSELSPSIDWVSPQTPSLETLLESCGSNRSHWGSIDGHDWWLFRAAPCRAWCLRSIDWAAADRSDSSARSTTKWETPDC